jgi:uncharacterized protein YjeT (DUF2065 family)
MKNFIYTVVSILSVMWIMTGTSFVIYTKQTRSFFRKVVRREYFPIWAAIALVLGPLLIIGSFFSGRIVWLAMILGIIACVKGVYLLKGPPEQTDRIITWWYDSASDETIRFAGLATLLLGIVVLVYLL